MVLWAGAQSCSRSREPKPWQSNPKSETRNPKQILITQIPIIETQIHVDPVGGESSSSTASGFRTFENSNFVFVSDFDIRYSNFN